MSTKFEDLLSDVGGIKTAAVELPNRQQTEQDFSGLAFAFLRDRAADLIPYLVGFEVVEQDPTGSRAVGIFGFRVGESDYQVPVFFLNSQIKGMDSIHLVGEGKIVPLQSAWIDHLLNRKAMILGAPASQETVQGVTPPDFSFMGGPPGGGKFASFDGRQAFIKMSLAIDHHYEKSADFRHAIGSLLYSLEKTANFRSSAENSILLPYLEKIGGPDQTVTFLELLQRDPRWMKAASSFYDVAQFSALEYDLEKTSAPSLEVVTDSEAQGTPCCPDTARRLLRYRVAYKDTRKGEDKAQVEDMDYAASFSNPAENGCYSAMLAGAILHKVYIATEVTPLDSWGSTEGQCLIIPTESIDASAQAPAGLVHVCEMANVPRDREYLYNQGKPLAEALTNTPYVMVNAQGQVTSPFKISSAIKKNGDHIQLEISHGSSAVQSCGSSYDDPGLATPRKRGFSRTQPVQKLMLVDRAGALTDTGESTCVVPTESWKLFELPAVPSTGDDSWEQQRTACRLVEPATLSEILATAAEAGFQDMGLHTEMKTYTLDLNGEEVAATKNASAQEIFSYLVCQVGMDQSDADELIKSAEDAGSARRFVKLGQVMMPPAHLIPPGIDPATGRPLDQFQEQYITGQSMPPMPPMPNDPRFPDQGQMQSQVAAAAGAGGGMPSSGMPPGMGGGMPGAPVDPNDPTALAMQAAESGQQQVFDSAAIGTLSNTYDTSHVLDTYLPVLEDALDRLGRILFLFYWKNEDFARRYGDQDITALEDQLRSVFKSFGDLVLKFRQKSIDAEVGIEDLGV